MNVGVSGEGGDVSGDSDGAGTGGETSRARQGRAQHEPTPGGASVSPSDIQTSAEKMKISLPHLSSSASH